MRLYILVVLVWNSFVFCCYGYDKRQARVKGRRLSEKSLLTMTYLLGGVGAYLGALVFHHKTKKWYFQLSWTLGIIVLLLVSYYLWRMTNEWKIHF